jgi:hypothetical protein
MLPSGLHAQPELLEIVTLHAMHCMDVFRGGVCFSWNCFSPLCETQFCPDYLLHSDIPFASYGGPAAETTSLPALHLSSVPAHTRPRGLPYVKQTTSLKQAFLTQSQADSLGHFSRLQSTCSFAIGLTIVGRCWNLQQRCEACLQCWRGGRPCPRCGGWRHRSGWCPCGGRSALARSRT